MRGLPYNVSYDSRALLINGQRTLLQSGSVHYPRAPPAMWPSVIQQAKVHGLNMIETYVFWNWHEVRLGVYDFETEGHDLGAFLQTIADAGLFVHLRLGPYACAEWNYGGIPAWMKFQPNITFRTDNFSWEERSEQFVQVVLNRIEPFLARNGGPIVLAQVSTQRFMFQRRRERMALHWFWCER